MTVDDPDLAIVNGAFGYTGGYVARRLIDEGVRVRTLRRPPAAANPLGDLVETVPLDFSDPDVPRQAFLPIWRQLVLPVHLLILPPLAGCACPVSGGVNLGDGRVMHDPFDGCACGHSVR